jgi:hypothetical protein
MYHPASPTTCLPLFRPLSPFSIMPRLVFLLLALAACLTFAVASALPPRTLATGHGTAIEWSNVDKTTNAERLAAGLLPKKPRMLHEPSRPRREWQSQPC